MIEEVRSTIFIICAVITFSVLILIYELHSLKLALEEKRYVKIEKN